jgi:hypothetical protein
LFLAGNLIIIWVSALVKGAELTLENPPAPGETWVRVIDGNDEIFKGDKIVPIIKTPQPSAATIEISPVRLPTRPSDLQDWKRTWPLIKPLWEEKHYNYIKISSWLHSMHPDLPFSTKTIREIIIAGKRGLLD